MKYLEIKIIKNRKYDFIFIGKFIDRKNLTLLISVFRKLRKIYPNIKLNVIGGKKFLKIIQIFFIKEH